MTIEEIRKKAPCGATHYCYDCGELHYLKDCDGYFRIYDLGFWIQCETIGDEKPL